MSALHAVEPFAQAAAVPLDAVRGRPTLTVPEAAAFLGLGRNSVYDAVHRGEIPSLRIDARILIPVAPLLKLVGIEGL